MNRYAIYQRMPHVGDRIYYWCYKGVAEAHTEEGAIASFKLSHPWIKCRTFRVEFPEPLEPLTKQKEG
jgi:hypothetical protein